jgi:hypothetical protein
MNGKKADRSESIDLGVADGIEAIATSCGGVE